MAAPTKKTSKMRTKRRFASFVSKKRKKLAAGLRLVACSNCGASRRAHHACLACGFYRGRQVIDVAGKKQKKVTTIEA